MYKKNFRAMALTDFRKLGKALFIGIVVLLLIMQSEPFYAAMLENLASHSLLSLWSVKDDGLSGPSCGSNTRLPGTQRQLWERLALMIPLNARASTHLGRMYWLQGRCKEALNQWKHAASAYDEIAAYELFRFEEYDGLPVGARQALASMAYRQALNLAINANNQLANRWALRAIALDPRRQDVSAIENWYTRSNDASAIRTIWQSMASAYAPDNSEYWFAQAKIHEQDGQWDLVAKAYLQGAGLSSFPREFWLQAGRAWEQISEWERAIQAYEQAVAIQPPSMSALVSLGNVYRIRGDYEDAVRYLRSAIEVEPDNFLPYHYLGLVFNGAGDPTQARLNFETALELSPGNAWEMYQLARVWYYGLSQTTIAESWLVRAIENLDQPPAIWWIELGDWRLTQSQCEGAQKAYSAALSAGVDQDKIESALHRYKTICAPN
jgi:tetratricopeptide (TPR) repeat protein